MLHTLLLWFFYKYESANWLPRFHYSVSFMRSHSTHWRSSAKKHLQIKKPCPRAFSCSAPKCLIFSLSQRIHSFSFTPISPWPIQLELLGWRIRLFFRRNLSEGRDTQIEDAESVQFPCSHFTRWFSDFSNSLHTYSCSRSDKGGVWHRDSPSQPAHL